MGSIAVLRIITVFACCLASDGNRVIAKILRECLGFSAVPALNCSFLPVEDQRDAATSVERSDVVPRALRALGSRPIPRMSNRPVEI